MDQNLAGTLCISIIFGAGMAVGYTVALFRHKLINISVGQPAEAEKDTPDESAN